jgi:glycosyltransferase involved in cell wall biosynthesis
MSFFMKIGVDVRMPFYRMGGISQYVLHLLPALAAVDKVNEYVVFQNWRDGRFLAPSSPQFRRANAYTPCHHRLEKWTLSAEIAPRRLDLFHSPDFIPPAFGARRFAITVHDLNFIYFPQFLTAESKRYYAGQIQWAVDRADIVICDSFATRADVLTHLRADEAKVHAVHLAANPLYTRPFPAEAITQTLQKYNLPAGFILHVGTLEPRKNIPTLLNAYHLLRQETAVSVPLVLVGGKGWIYDDIFATIQSLQLQNDVHHLTGVSDEELAHLYHAAAVLVTPSFYEGFGLPALEAQHCGCPVIVSRRGSLPEIVGDEGMMVDDPEDVGDWADKIAQVISDSQLRDQMIETGLRQAAQFSWEKCARQHLALYQNAGM